MAASAQTRTPSVQMPLPPQRAALLSVLAIAALAVSGAATTALAQGAANTPPAVVVAPVRMSLIEEQQEFTGRVQAIQEVNLTARVEGYLESVNFVEGSDVTKGEVLYQIEKGPYEASLAEAKAQLASADASLAKSQATLKNAQVNLERQQELVQRGTVSQAVLDDATAERDSASADVQGSQAEIANANASIQTAQLNLDYTTISAAIDGRIGATAVTVGNLVSSSTGSLATLVQIDPMRVAFALPDRLFVDFVEETGGTNDAEIARKTFQPRVVLPNGKTYEHPGTIAFASNEIDQSTGTITVYADFPNPKGILLPGAFVVVSVQRADQEKAPTIPASAVIRDREGPYVFVVDNNDTAQIRRITIAQRTASEVSVSSGLTEGETIIVSGLQRVIPGEKVTPTAQQAPPVGGGSAAATSSPAAPASSAAGSPDSSAVSGGSAQQSSAAGSQTDGTSAAQSN